MKYFTKDFTDFFKELGANNNKTWFESNKPRYIKSVKEPFEAFIEEMIKQMKKTDKKITLTPKESIFRIYRDVRFSKDKTPYKSHMSAAISSGGKKDWGTPGMYIQLGAEDCRLYSGIYETDKERLYQIREYMTGHLKKLDALINDKTFKKQFGEIRGEKQKRLPKEFQEAAVQQPLLYNKNFYFFTKFKPEIVVKSDLVETYMKHYKTTEPLRKYFISATG